MNESEFTKIADETILAIEESIESAGIDVDYENADGVLTLEFDNGSKIIINKQTPARQIWVAAKSGGFHYNYENNQWRNDQDQTELLTELSKLMSEQAGEKITLI